METEQKITSMFDILKNLINSEMTKKVINITSSYDNGFIFSGVGKNWYICEKIDKTFTSLGIQSNTLDVVHALHGDIGMIKNQFLFFVSKSGKTRELITLVDYLLEIRDKNIINPTFIGLFLDNTSPLISKLDYSITPTKDVNLYEFDSKNLIPTLSINILQMLLDYIGVQIFENNPSLVEVYKYHHPAGEIGKKLDMNGHI